MRAGVDPPLIEEHAPQELLGPLNAVEKKNAPSRLFTVGDPDLLRSGPRVSVVGSRKIDPRVEDAARRFADAIARRGVIVVSGLAEGVDTAAHVAAMAAGGRTIAILGTPLDECFPAKNRGLQMSIMRDHLAVSQFASGSPSERGNFPRRNRTMALLSDATVIVAAGDKSGSLHQGWEALRLGRPLFLFGELLRDSSLTWATEMERYGASVIDPGNLDSLFDSLPERARGESAELAL